MSGSMPTVRAQRFYIDGDKQQLGREQSHGVSALVAARSTARWAALVLRTRVRRIVPHHTCAAPTPFRFPHRRRLRRRTLPHSRSLSLSLSLYFAAQYKIVLIGDAGVGKTQMLAAFTRAGDDVQTRPTIGVEFGTKVVDLPDGGQCKAQIWDTAGQERYRAITSSHYRRAQGALVVCDVTQPKSFTNATSLWLRELKEATSPDGGTHECIVLCGNKIDLVPEDETAAVTAEQLEKAGEEHDLLVARTSAITGENIKEAFETLIHKVHEVQLVQQRYQLAQTAAHQAVDLNASQYASSSKKKCC
tara:strand:+ start:85 stop:996 length:912 start_codon:yes stop_codon:yes gene_type:complete